MNAAVVRRHKRKQMELLFSAAAYRVLTGSMKVLLIAVNLVGTAQQVITMVCPALKLKRTPAEMCGTEEVLSVALHK